MAARLPLAASSLKEKERKEEPESEAAVRERRGSLAGRRSPSSPEPSPATVLPSFCQHCGGRFRFNMCPRNCSGQGECRPTNSSKVVECECSEHWKGEACDIPYCPDDCGFPERGQCSRNVSQGCVCYAG